MPNPYYIAYESPLMVSFTGLFALLTYKAFSYLRVL